MDEERLKEIVFTSLTPQGEQYLLNHHSFGREPNTEPVPVTLAIKDLIDLKGYPTTCGSNIYRDSPDALNNADCLNNIIQKAADGKVLIVGKTTLNELAYGADGVNPSFGTPPNPYDDSRICGGSSSGSAVSVATRMTNYALGTDTGGSIRIPAACCNISGLKTTARRVANGGTVGLAPAMDTIGPMAISPVELARAMDLLEPGFSDAVQKLVESSAIITVARVRRQISFDDPQLGSAQPGFTKLAGQQNEYVRHSNKMQCDPNIDYAIDELLERAHQVGIINLVQAELPLWDETCEAGVVVLMGQAWQQHGHLLTSEAQSAKSDSPDSPRLSPQCRTRLESSRPLTQQAIDYALAQRDQTMAELETFFTSVDIVALPTLGCLAPRFENAHRAPLTNYTRYANLTQIPALATPIQWATNRWHGSSRPNSVLRPSLQLMGPWGNDEVLVALAIKLAALDHATPNFSA